MLKHRAQWSLAKEKNVQMSVIHNMQVVVVTAQSIDAVHQGNWSLPIKSRLEGFVIVA